MPFTRRTFMALAIAAAVGQAYLTPTPACADDDEPTPSQTEGPYFKAESPERTNLAAEGAEGKPLILKGTVRGTDGAPVPKALLDFWHADAKGDYDNEGFTFRGHLFTGEDGAFTLKTIVPGKYPGRTVHIHVRAQRPEGKILTTQLYFPGVPENDKDGIFNKALLLTTEEKDGVTHGRFGFVLPA